MLVAGFSSVGRFLSFWLFNFIPFCLEWIYFGHFCFGVCCSRRACGEWVVDGWGVIDSWWVTYCRRMKFERVVDFGGVCFRCICLGKVDFRFGRLFRVNRTPGASRWLHGEAFVGGCGSSNSRSSRSGRGSSGRITLWRWCVKLFGVVGIVGIHHALHDLKLALLLGLQ